LGFYSCRVQHIFNLKSAWDVESRWSGLGLVMCGHKPAHTGNVYDCHIPNEASGGDKGKACWDHRFLFPICDCWGLCLTLGRVSAMSPLSCGAAAFNSYLHVLWDQPGSWMTAQEWSLWWCREMKSHFNETQRDKVHRWTIQGAVFEPQYSIHFIIHLTVGLNCILGKFSPAW
jgi:hypothetical protein